MNKRMFMMIFIISFVYGMMYLLNYNYPLFFDDWNYSFIYLSDERIHSIADIFRSQYIHYFTWGGRTVVHIICQALLMLDFWLICALNAAAYIALIYLMYRIANKNKTLNPIVFFVCHIAVWFFQIAFCSNVLWKTGAANYLWGMLIVLLFIYPYYTYYLNKKSSDNTIKIILFFIGGIIAGWTNENVGIALNFYILVSLLLYKKEGMRIPKWAIFGLVGSIIGCLAMLAAPGNFIRLESVERMVVAQGRTMFDIYIFNLITLCKYSAQTILPLVVVYMGGLIIYKRQQGGNIWKDPVIKSSLLFLATGLIALLALMASSVSEKRAMFGIIIFFIIPAVQIYANIDFKKNPLKALNIIILSLLFIYYIVDYTWKYQTIKIASTAWKEREPIIEEYKCKGIDTITFTNRYQIHVKYGLQDLSDDPEDLVNTVASKYYGFKYMRAIDKESNDE